MENNIICQKKFSFGLLDIQHNVMGKIKSKYKVSTMCRRSNADTNIPAAIAVFSMIFFDHVKWNFFLNYYQRVMSIIKICQSH